MKTAKKKTAKAVKKGIPASRGPKAGGAPLLEVGKYYGARVGRGIARINEIRDGMAYGKWVEVPEPWFDDEDSWKVDGRWAIKGSTVSVNEKYDLVREVPRPPRARK